MESAGVCRSPACRSSRPQRSSWESLRSFGSRPRKVPDVSLQLKIWGCRGSIPTPGASTVRFGGNTSCVEVRTADGGCLILDGGTGLRQLGAQLEVHTPLHV